MKKKKKVKIKKKPIIVMIVIIIIVIVTLLLILLFNNSRNELIGTWVTEGGIIYEFKEKHEGVMKTSLSDYKFTYKIKDNIISIDFVEKKAYDSDYEYSFENSKLILKGNRGTFTFIKK